MRMGRQLTANRNQKAFCQLVPVRAPPIIGPVMRMVVRKKENKGNEKNITESRAEERYSGLSMYHLESATFILR